MNKPAGFSGFVSRFISSEKKKIYLFIYIFALLSQLCGIFIFKNFYKGEIEIYDPRFEQAAHNFLEKGTFRIDWGTDGTPDTIMVNPYEVQKGVYYNWFPFGYAVFLLVPMSAGKYYVLIRTIVQLLLFSLIPAFIFNLLRYLFVQKEKGAQLSFVASLLFCFYPYFLISSLWGSDTWMLFFFNLIMFNFFIRYIEREKIHPLLPGILMLALFFLKPVMLVPYILIALGTLVFSWRREVKNEFKTAFILFLPLIIGMLGWGCRNYYISQRIVFTQSNNGYNLWLGNNEYTNRVLSSRLGDGSTIEDDIFPLVDKKWSFLKNYSEYEKDAFFKQAAIDFIKANPVVTVKNSLWKTVGFWSPLRMRSGHWSESKSKTFMTVLFAGPLLFLSLLSIIRFFIKKEYDWSRKKKIVVAFIFLWMVPYILFFSTFRYRTPLDFLLLYLAMDFIEPYISKNKFLSGIL
jgi:4-amino-4-deoxy-L-arabinose transferase-like glycosyltransferase